jgi:hypothetical protein
MFAASNLAPDRSNYLAIKTASPVLIDVGVFGLLTLVE